VLPPEICFHATQCSSSTLCVESSIHGLNLDHDMANLSNENLQHSKESKSWPVPLRSFQDNISIYYRLFMIVFHAFQTQFPCSITQFELFYVENCGGILVQLKRNRGLDNVRLAGRSVNNSNSAACRLLLPFQ